MEEERLKQIRAALNDGTENEIGIGVGNIYRRVMGLYEDGEMHIYSQKGCGTAVQLAFTPKDIGVLESGVQTRVIVQGDLKIGNIGVFARQCRKIGE